MAHKTKTHPTECGRLLVTDNFFTRHKMDNNLLKLIDREERMLGNIRINIVHKVNRPNSNMIFQLIIWFSYRLSPMKISVVNVVYMHHVIVTTFRLRYHY